MGHRGPTLPSKQYVSILSQNLRGLNDDKEAELILRLTERKVWAACLQETWKHGDSVHRNEGFTFLEHGLAEKVCHRGSQGVAIVLSPDAREVWERAGSLRMTFGERILATRLIVLDSQKRPLTIFLVSAYAPDSGRPVEEHEAYASNLQRCF